MGFEGRLRQSNGLITTQTSLKREVDNFLPLSEAQDYNFIISYLSSIFFPDLQAA